MDRQTNARTSSCRGRCCLTEKCVFLLVLHRNSSEWTNLWVRRSEGQEQEEAEELQQLNRVMKDPVKEQLIIRRVTEEDGGTYKVLDLHGLAISTTQLSIQGEALAPPPSSLSLDPSNNSNPTVFFLWQKSLSEREKNEQRWVRANTGRRSELLRSPYGVFQEPL